MHEEGVPVFIVILAAAGIISVFIIAAAVIGAVLKF